MVRLVEIDAGNWTAFRRLSVCPAQEVFLDTAVGILARGYVYRGARARVIGICEGDLAVGLALVRDLDEAPACYDLQQFMIDFRFQGRGLGADALQLILGELAQERKYPCVEVCVRQDDLPALRLYEKAGFADTGYVDEDAPNCRNLTYYFDVEPQQA